GEAVARTEGPHVAVSIRERAHPARLPVRPPHPLPLPLPHKVVEHLAVNIDRPEASQLVVFAPAARSARGRLPPAAWRRTRPGSRALLRHDVLLALDKVLVHELVGRGALVRARPA